MVRTTIFLVLGFLLFISGFLSFILLLIGAQLSYLTWIDRWGGTTGLVIRLVMIFGGMIMLYLARTKFQK